MLSNENYSIQKIMPKVLENLEQYQEATPKEHEVVQSILESEPMDLSGLAELKYSRRPNLIQSYRESGQNPFVITDRNLAFVGVVSQMQAFVKGERASNYLYIHPADAVAHGLTEGGSARVSANGNHIDIPVRLDDDMMPGTVSVPHGWGHQRAAGLSVASKTTGVNVNIILPDGPDSIEPASGMAHMNGVIVAVTALGPGA